MAKPKIFIDSSERTLELTKQLRAQLNSDYCVAELWTERMEKSIPTLRTAATKEYEFAVIILTRADVMATSKGDTRKARDDARKARDNCVFEAGLFIGVIGAERCLLLSSAEASELPSDLAGIKYLSFTEPPNLNDPDQCRKAIVTAATRIESLVRTATSIENRPLSLEMLQERERSIHEGGDLLGDQVVVTSVQPLDPGYAAARQVRKNIDNNDIKYIYFFRGDWPGACKTCELLQKILLANILANQTEADDSQIRLQKLASNQIEIKRDLEKICKENKIKIFFLADPPALQYCIHNAMSDTSARLYLRRGDEFIEWESGPEAHRFWEEVGLARGASKPDLPKAIFYGVPGFDVNGPTFSNILKAAMEDYFPDMVHDVMKLCLEGEVKSKIFIASSGRTLELAKQLRAQLNPNYCVAELWTEASQKHVGKSIFAMLKDATKEYDFAVVILAKDDVMVTRMNDNMDDIRRKARDNCVFEAGLFMGVIGETRCILLSSVEENDLPTDLRGIIHLSFTEPPHFDDPNECRAAIVTPATKIENLVRSR